MGAERRAQTPAEFAERSRSHQVLNGPEPEPKREERRRRSAAARERLIGLGLLLVGVGTGAIYWPAGLIVPGVYLLVLTWPRRSLTNGPR